jgi:hypothetical protein
MKQNGKRIMSLFLTILLCLSLLPMGALASEEIWSSEEETPASDIEAESEPQGEEIAEEAAEELPAEPAEEPAEELVEESAEEPAEEPTEEPVQDGDDGDDAEDTGVISGTCGNDLTWTLADGVLTISGTGNMKANYGYRGAPWYAYRDDIVSVVV